MSKIQQFAPNSFFEPLSVSNFKISIRQPIVNPLQGLVMSMLFMILPLTYQGDTFSTYLCWMVNRFFILACLYSILYSEKIVIDVNKNNLVKRKCLAGLTFKTIQINWPLDSYYLNENVFDSYQRITNVWMKAKSEESKNSKRLLEFSSQDQYLGFIKVLKESFPTLQIRDWHD